MHGLDTVQWAAAVLAPRPGAFHDEDERRQTSDCIAITETISMYASVVAWPETIRPTSAYARDCACSGGMPCAARFCAMPEIRCWKTVARRGIGAQIHLMFLRKPLQKSAQHGNPDTSADVRARLVMPAT